jgi:hypothetical protein
MSNLLSQRFPAITANQENKNQNYIRWKKSNSRLKNMCRALCVRVSTGIGVSVGNTLVFCRRWAENRSIQLISGQFRLAPAGTRLNYAEPHMVGWLGRLTGCPRVYVCQLGILWYLADVEPKIVLYSSYLANSGLSLWVPDSITQNRI